MKRNLVASLFLLSMTNAFAYVTKINIEESVRLDVPAYYCYDKVSPQDLKKRLKNYKESLKRAKQDVAKLILRGKERVLGLDSLVDRQKLKLSQEDARNYKIQIWKLEPFIKDRRKNCSKFEKKIKKLVNDNLKVCENERKNLSRVLQKAGYAVMGSTPKCSSEYKVHPLSHLHSHVSKVSIGVIKKLPSTSSNNNETPKKCPSTCEVVTENYAECGGVVYVSSEAQNNQFRNFYPDYAGELINSKDGALPTDLKK